MEHADVIREHGIDAIQESFDLDLDVADVVEFEVEDEGYVDWSLPKNKWMEFLSSSIEPLVKKEEYSKLVKVRELMRTISEKSA